MRKRSFVDVLEEFKTQGTTGMQDAAAAAAADSSARSLQKRVLVVDDNENNLLVMTNMLVPNGYLVELARSGEECLQILNSRIGTDDVPEVVLLDVMMGRGISGVECCAEIRQYRGMGEHELPVILVTASDSDSLLQKGFEAGATDYIQKPFSLRVLLARLENALRLRELFTATVSRERDRSLLRRILPESIIERLESGQNLIADHHESVTVLFSDIVGFTELSQNCSTAALMLMLNELFSAFDKALDRHGIYKVETIGDAYMCVAGHDGVGGHAERMAAFAREMLEVCDRIKPPFKNEKKSPEHSMVDDDSPSYCLHHSLSRDHEGSGSPGGEKKLQIRIGMHSGKVHAGVVGTRCPRYCFFGDTVNTASRMESNSFPMAVHISNSTAMLLEQGGSVETILLGPRFIKGKGMMRTHVLCMGDFMGACKAFEFAQNAAMNAAANGGMDAAALERTQSPEAQSMMANLFDTDTWVMNSIEVGLPGEGRPSVPNLQVQPAHALRDRLFNSYDSALPRKGHAEGPRLSQMGPRLSSEGTPRVSRLSDCGDGSGSGMLCCCVANGMLSAADTTFSPEDAVPLLPPRDAAAIIASQFEDPNAIDQNASAIAYLVGFVQVESNPADA
jgi:class 3 adenylate cyclase